MKVWIVSDLHCDHYAWTPSTIPEHDALIIAGDVGAGREDTLLHLYRVAGHTYAPLIFVPGNHDVFGDALDAFDGDGSLARDGIHVLSTGQSVILSGVRFVGATLWTDFLLSGDRYGAEAWAAQKMPEYAKVRRPDGALIWPADTIAAHARHRAAIESVLATLHHGPTIVVSHHAPSRRSIAGAVEVSDAAFASDLDEMMLRHQPELWVHGHIHQHRNYLIGSTRVLANPGGYADSEWCENPRFIEDFVVDVQ